MAQKRAIEEETSAFKVVKRSYQQAIASHRSDPDDEEPEEVSRESGYEPDFGAGTRKKVNRCSGCRRKVGLMGFRCRCGDLFCSEHRYSDRHVCDFDYKAAGRAAIARENPVVRPAKILKV